MTEREKTRSELKREAIIEAAKRAFEEFGVQGTSMDKLAEMAGVSKRTVYNHFASKEELVLHLISDLWQRSMVDVDIPYSPDESLDAQLARLLEAEVALVSGGEFLGLARIATGHFLYHPEALQERIAEFDALETALHRWLRAAAEDGKLKPLDTSLAVKQLHSLIKGSCYYLQLLGIAPELDEDEKAKLVRDTVELFLSHYRA